MILSRSSAGTTPHISRTLPDDILLIGMMGAGKTTVGRRLAEHLGWRYLDSDEEVETSTGRTVREIFESDGEDAFRVEETRVLREALLAPGQCVISVAGGAVLSSDNRVLIADGGTVVWLRAATTTLAARVGGDDHRPLLGDDPAAALDRLYAVRRPLYEQLADVTVDVDDISPDEAVRTIVAAL